MANEDLVRRLETEAAVLDGLSVTARLDVEANAYAQGAEFYREAAAEIRTLNYALEMAVLAAGNCDEVVCTFRDDDNCMCTKYKAAAAWFGWNVVAPLAFILAALVIAGLFQIPRMVRQARCDHLRFFETSACDAICSDCRKNLGFIGTVRDARDALSHQPEA